MSDDIHFQLLRAMDQKLDRIVGDMSKVGERVAVVEEKTESIDPLTDRVTATEKKVGMLWAVSGWIGALIVSLAGSIVAYLGGLFGKGDV